MRYERWSGFDASLDQANLRFSIKWQGSQLCCWSFDAPQKPVKLAIKSICNFDAVSKSKPFVNISNPVWDEIFDANLDNQRKNNGRFSSNSASDPDNTVFGLFNSLYYFIRYFHYKDFVKSSCKNRGHASSFLLTRPIIWKCRDVLVRQWIRTLCYDCTSTATAGKSTQKSRQKFNNLNK